MRCQHTRYLVTRFVHDIVLSFVCFTCNSTLGLWFLITLWYTGAILVYVACVYVHVCMCGPHRVISNQPSPMHIDFLLVQCTLHWLISILHSQLASSNPISCPARLINQPSGSLHLDPAPAGNRFRVKTQAFRNGSCGGGKKSACR